MPSDLDFAVLTSFIMPVYSSDGLASNDSNSNSNNANNNSFNSPTSDPWLSLASASNNNNNSNNMDAELASIVSSLSALSNPSNNPQMGPGGGSASAMGMGAFPSSGSNQQLGGFRRNSFTTSDVDSDIAGFNNSNAMSALSVGASANMDHSPLMQQRSTQSIGTAPPYTSNMFNINYKLFQHSQQMPQQQQQMSQQQQMQMQQMQQQQMDSKTVSFALNSATAGSGNGYGNYHARTAAAGQYSASIAGPILQGYAQQSGAHSHVSGMSSSAAGAQGNNRGGFFQQLGQSLVEGTKELEFDSGAFAAPANAHSGSQMTLDNSVRSSDIDEYTDYNSSGTAPNDNMFYNSMNAPAFKPGNGQSPPQGGMAPNGQYFMGYPPNAGAGAATGNGPPQPMFYPPPPGAMPHAMFAGGEMGALPEGGAVPPQPITNNGELPGDIAHMGQFSPQSPNALPVNNVSDPQMFMPQNNNNNNQRNPYIYIQNPQMGSPPMQNPAAFPAMHAQKENVDIHNNNNSHVNNGGNKGKMHGKVGSGGAGGPQGGNQKNRKNQNNGQANPYLDQAQQNYGKSSSSKQQQQQQNVQTSPFSSKNSSHSSTSVSSVLDDHEGQHDGGKKKGGNAQASYHRSALLEDIRNYASSNNNAAAEGGKIYHLKDILGHTLEFCKDQYGSRFIQKELATASASEREVLFNEIRDHAIMLSNDVFGNYVIQKFFEYGSTTQKDILVDQFRGNMKELSMQMYACRVIQKALEFISPTQRIELVDELKKCVLKMIKDQNGNHVIQKAIETIPIELLPFVLKSLIGHIYHLSTHSYGCRVIQRLLEFGYEEDQKIILSELKDFIPYLIQDQYGNYVIQYILQHGSDNDSSEILHQTKQDIIDIISENVIEFSKHKFASNVVEKAVLYGTKSQKALIISKILPKDKEHAMNLEDNSPMILMMRDQFANYVVQKLVTVTEGEGKKLIVIAIRAYLDKLNKSNSLGNRHLASVEKLAALVESVEI